MQRAVQPKIVAMARIARPRAARQTSGRWSSDETVAREQQEVGGNHRRADVRVKPGCPFPHAAREPEDALQERDPALNPGPEAPQLVVHPLAPHHIAEGEAPLLGETDIDHAELFRVGEILLRREGAVKTGLLRRAPEEPDLPPQERYRPGDIRRIPLWDRAIEDEA